MPRQRRISTARKRYEEKVLNHRFQHNLRMAAQRSELRTEQARLNNLLHQSILPGLRERVKKRQASVAELLQP
jgi:hypothetical protein